MIQIFEGNVPPGGCPIRDNMYRDRKRVFVDLLGWDVPVMDDQFEIDAFDTESAVYLVAAGSNAAHLGSARLLPTDRPHLLGSLFPDLCDDAVPMGRDIWEITRACLSPRLRARERLKVRNQLMSAALVFADIRGISSYTCVADSAWLTQIPGLGWHTEPLGPPRPLHDVITGALQLHITDDTIDRFKAAGTWEEVRLERGDLRAPLAA